MTRNPHTAVSNQPGEREDLTQGPAIFHEPSKGEPGAESPLTANGLEKVPGHVHVHAENVAAKVWIPPSVPLHDIGEASFGAAAATIETVHGPDDRVQITDTANYPWRAHSSLLITAADNSQWIGTGWFIGPHTLATAGHVVHIKNSGVPGCDGWVKSIQVMPGRNAGFLPYGSVTSTNFRSVEGWTESGDENHDYGAIIIPTELGSTTGWFGLGVWPDADLLGTSGNISGYPGDQPVGTQWYDARVISSVNALKVYYDIDTAGGQSGSAVYREHNDGRYAIAVHAYGGPTTNSGTRITRAVYDNLRAWSA
ncbi:trypsin-like serine peptidase [Streptomyces griseoloalbus]|uniref:Serine protease n=1 Tax=Streptomyces griseoloalbus TaxID=67303 RepID=A0A7W8FBW1_9ACTN|nr:endopeptidase [Streptomyces albaduncus]MBB5128734.1 V8-like Glu-specific endopeptidase [Streptomyces albaduncus]GGW46419.1 hypothetical protein GCM10010340_25620 [Streptomyces albaduncus]